MVFEDKDNDGVYTEGTDLALGYWDYSAPMNPNMVGEVTINLAGTRFASEAAIEHYSTKSIYKVDAKV